jgi:hypothetical protein
MLILAFTFAVIDSWHSKVDRKPRIWSPKYTSDQNARGVGKSNAAFLSTYCLK